ncbi:homeobox protein MSX-2-like [Magallana gigas]|uniref:homeobox protein MSX-2-like n=1 Tax=Magallana gigas TaxID=29159 RepID=UPI00333E345A
MDMLASFFASNYALYANDPRHFGMWFPATSHQPTPYSALIHPYPSTDGRHLIKTPPERIESRKKETKTETVNFSIENILRDKSSTKEDDQQSLFDTNTADTPEKEDDTTTQFSWLQCTRYKPPKLPRLKKKDGMKKRKLGRNPRVPFTQHQVAVLEHKFRRTHYLSSMDVAELSTALSLTENRVKIWFQNRRARERRDREAIQRNQTTQPSSSETIGPTEWPYPVSRPNSTQCGESLHDTRSVFSLISTSN